MTKILSALIVEDEALHAFNFSRILKELGFEDILIAIDALEAIHLAEKSPPDLVLMDIRLPGKIDGRVAAQVILSKLDVPLVFVTSHGDKAASLEGNFEAPDGIGYVVKPYTDAEIKNEVQRVMDQFETANA
jgi:CheY-like chemotaxis protein